MSMLLRKLFDSKISLKKKIVYFVAVYSFKLVVLITILWIFWTVRIDLLEIYERCEPFIVHAVNLSNHVWINITNLTVINATNVLPAIIP